MRKRITNTAYFIQHCMSKGPVKRGSELMRVEKREFAREFRQLSDAPVKRG